MNGLNRMLVCATISVAAAAACCTAAAQPAAPSVPTATGALATARLQATVYEVRVPPESIAALDASRLAREADFAKALDGLGKKRLLYAVDQRVNLAGDRLMTASHEPTVTSTRVTATGQKLNTVTYQDMGVVIKIKGVALADRSLGVEADIEVSTKSDSPVNIAQDTAAPSFRKFVMSLKGIVGPGKPVVILTADADSRDADGRAVLCVCRVVMGADEGIDVKPAP